MTTHNQVAKSVREDKEAHPERYCAVKSCLWKTAVVAPDGKDYILNARLCRKHEVSRKILMEVVRDEAANRSTAHAVSPETRALAEDTFARIERSNEAIDKFHRTHG